MKIRLSAAVLGVALAMGVSIPFEGQAMGVAGGAAGGGHLSPGFGGHGFGPRHGLIFHHGFFRPVRPFHRPFFNFGAGFRSHQSNEFSGGYGGNDSDDDYGGYGDDIEDLHFRVQEPFGPGDIGRPPARADQDVPYDSGDPRDGNGPADW